MQRIVALLFILILNINAYSQPVVSYSEPFKEMEGSYQILLLKNGTTVLLNDSEDGLCVSVFDQNHKSIAKQNNEYNLWTDRKFSALNIRGMYEIGNTISLFITVLNRGNMLMLHRIDIDLVTAKFIKAELIAEMPTQRSWGMTLDNEVTNRYYIEQDPVTNNYAILFFEGYTLAKSDRVSVKVYDSNNKVIRQAILENANNTRFAHYGGMCMYNNSVYVCFNEYDNQFEKTAAPVYINVLKDGSDKFISQKLTIPLYNMRSDNTLKYNAGAKTLCMLTNSETASDMKGRFGGYTTITKSYAAIITLINPDDLTVTTSKVISTPKAHKYAIVKVGNDDGFNGVTPSMEIGADNSITILPVSKRSISHGSWTEMTTDQVGIIYLDNTGTETDAYVMRVPESSGSMYSNSASFAKSYISTPTGNYLVMNDLEENFSRPENERPHKMTSISDANTILCKIGDGKIVKSYMFGIPERKSSNFSFQNSGVYDKTTNTYVTVMVKNDKGDKQAHVAWVKF